MTDRRKLHDDEFAIAAAYAAGEKLSSIARRYGVDIRRISNIAGRNGVPKRPAGRPVKNRGAEGVTGTD